MDSSADDLRPLREALRAVLVWSWLAVLAGLVGAAFGWVAGAKILPGTKSATATLTLTDEVVWPNFDAAAERQAAFLDDPKLFARAQSEVADSGSLLAFHVKTSTGDARVRLTVDGSNPNAAVRGANALAQLVVDASKAERAATYTANAAQMKGDLDRVDAQLADLQSKLAALAQRQGELEVLVRSGNNAAQYAQYIDVQTQRQTLSRTLDAVTDQRNDLQKKYDSAQINAQRTNGEVYLLRPATPDKERNAKRTGAVIGATIAFVLAVLLAPLLERRFGRARDVDAVLSVVGDTSVVDLTDDDPILPSSGSHVPQLIALTQGARGGPRSLAVVSLSGSRDSAALLDVVHESVGSEVGSGLVDAGGVHDEAALPVLLASAGAVLVIRKDRGSSGRLARVVRRLRALEVPIAGVVLLGPNGRGASARRAATAARADGIRVRA